MANSDYIFREAVKQIIAAQCGECADACLEFDGIQPDCNQCLLNGAKEAIESIPAADVRPVVRKPVVGYDELVKRLRAQADAERYFVGEDMLYDKAADVIEELSATISKMEKATRWIPVNERLPEENALCIVYNKDYGPMVGWRVDGERFRIPGSHFPDHPTHWMPLPEPPKEE